MFRRMTAKDDAIDPLEQGKKILGGLGIATLIVFVGPLILFEEEVPGTPGTPAPAASAGVAGGKTANFMTKIEGEVEAGARSLLEIFKWVLLAATVGAIVFLRMARVPANRLQSSR